MGLVIQNRPIQCETILRTRDVERITSLHRQSIWRKVKAGTFPKPKKLGNQNAWSKTEIEAWVRSVLDGQAGDAA